MQLKSAIREGISGGCLNTTCWPSWIQYSSSHSIGTSMSILFDYISMVSWNYPTSTYSSSHTLHGLPRPSQPMRSCTTRHLRRCASIIRYDSNGKETHQKARFLSSSSAVGVAAYVMRLYAPISCADRSPWPISE